MAPLYSLWVATLAALPVVFGRSNITPQKLSQLADMGLTPDGSTLTAEKAFKIAVDAASSGQGPTEQINEEFVQLKLDQFGSDNQTFPNRFWVAQSGYKPGGPVFLYDVGEADAGPSALFRLQNPSSFVKQIVDHFGGIGIAWEHRYYGKSVPANISLDTPASTFQYLTAEQALADVVQFANQFSRPNLSHLDLTPKGSPWVFLGGSYPGMRAAFIRNQYPDTIHASFASSAPVEASVDMSFYFDPVWRGMNAYGWGNCTKDINAAITYMDELMAHENTSAALKERFLGPGAAKNSNAGFADALSVIFYLWQSYGVDGGSYGLRSFCDWISTDPQTHTVSGPNGWAATKGPEFVVDRWTKWAPFTEATNTYLGSNCAGPNSTAQNADCNLELRFSDPAAISWTWQYCTQWGFFQSANLGPNQLVSSYNSLAHQRDICHRQFPDGSASGLLPELPRVNETNAHFGGWAIRPSNVYWSGGQFDPWRTLSPLSSESFSPHYKSTQDIPQCGVSTSADTLFSLVMDNAQHCYDFRTTFPGGAASRENFVNALTQWLKCFRAAPKEYPG